MCFVANAVVDAHNKPKMCARANISVYCVENDVIRSVHFTVKVLCNVDVWYIIKNLIFDHTFTDFQKAIDFVTFQ